MDSFDRIVSMIKQNLAVITVLWICRHLWKEKADKTQWVGVVHLAPETGGYDNHDYSGMCH